MVWQRHEGVAGCCDTLYGNAVAGQTPGQDVNANDGGITRTACISMVGSLWK